MVPTFYDSIEIARDRMVAKFHRRAQQRIGLLAFLQTFAEAILTLLLVRVLYRLVMKLFTRRSGANALSPAAEPL